jgi:flagellar biogenesis protein FliO
MTAAASSPAWGGMTAGIVAVVAFVVFSTWIVVQRVRSGRRHRDD